MPALHVFLSAFVLLEFELHVAISKPPSSRTPHAHQHLSLTRPAYMYAGGTICEQVA